MRLGGWIAHGLHRDLGCHAHIERYYTTIAVELGKQRGAELIDTLGGLRADVALYEGGFPTAIIEVKKYDEAGNDALIRRDLAKMRSLSVGTPLRTYLAVLVTDTAGKASTVRVNDLAAHLGGTFDILGPPEIAEEGRANWSWLFACGAFP